jgi:hypothetical protein
MATTQGRNISEFLNGFNGGLRVNRFEVTSSCTRLSKPFHIRSATIPGGQMTTIGLNWFGRTIEIPGERVYAPWPITVLDDSGTQEVHSDFEAWQHYIANKDMNTFVNVNGARTAGTSPKGCDFAIRQYLTHQDTGEKTFTLYNVWPVQVGPIELDMSKDNVLSQFNVILMYTHFSYV